jgi:PHD/YefM family antitoxin component YafN of YafNO toxin-antitoxin module
MNRRKKLQPICVADLTQLERAVIYNFMSKVTYTVSEAQANLPGLCRTGRRFVISRRDKPVYVAMPLEDYDALLETMELLSNPKAVATLRAAKAGRLAYKELDLADENFGL